MKYKAEWADVSFMRRESGDTLVEVLIATAILATAVVAGLGIMNFGFGSVINSIERTQVQAEMTSQLAMARFARDEFVRARGSVTSGGAAKEWFDIMQAANASPSANVCTATGDPSPATNAFHLEQDATNGVRRVPGDPSVATSVPTAGSGMWLEAVKVTTPSDVNYIDIYAKSCWQPSAGTISQESKSVTRLFVGQYTLAALPPPPPPSGPMNCSVLANFNYIENGDFSIGAGPGPGIVPAAKFESDLPNRGPDTYPDDDGLNNAPSLPWYTGGFSIQNGEKIYQAGALHGRPFPGDPARGVPASNTYFYSNPNQTLSQPRGTVTNFSGVLWRQTITGLSPNATYDFSIYIDNLLVFPGAADPRILLLSDGTPLTALQLDGVPTGSEIVVPRLPDQYRRVSLLFTTGPTQSTATLEVFDTVKAINGDDFAMTMMAVRRCIA